MHIIIHIYRMLIIIILFVYVSFVAFLKKLSKYIVFQNVIKINAVFMESH